jgi:hypothetical protein
MACKEIRIRYEAGWAPELVWTQRPEEKSNEYELREMWQKTDDDDYVDL